MGSLTGRDGLGEGEHVGQRGVLLSQALESVFGLLSDLLCFSFLLGLLFSRGLLLVMFLMVLFLPESGVEVDGASLLRDQQQSQSAYN